MSSLTLSAPAKLNLTLDILGTRPDGYHEMEMVMQSVSLCDEIHLHLGFPGGIRAESGLRFLPNDKGQPGRGRRSGLSAGHRPELDGSADFH